MTDRIQSPGTESAIAAAEAELAKTIDDRDIRAKLAELIVENLQRQQYRGGMRVLLRTMRGVDAQQRVADDLAEAGYSDGTVQRSGEIRSAAGVAARVLWDAENDR